MRTVTATLIEVIKVVTRDGDGTEADPCRYVTEYWSVEGDKLAEQDDWKETQPQAVRISTSAGSCKCEICR